MLIKKSTFIAVVGPVENKAQLERFFIKNKVLTATHNCWAYVLKNETKYSDDGEPSGTAGRPILNAIQSNNFTNTVALVIRHYGGIKLGTGGLTRAYGKAVREAIKDAQFKSLIPKTRVQLEVPFENQQDIYFLANQYDAQVVDQTFLETSVCFDVEINTADKKKWHTSIVQMTKGNVKILDPKN